MNLEWYCTVTLYFLYQSEYVYCANSEKSLLPSSVVSSDALFMSSHNVDDHPVENKFKKNIKKNNILESGNPNAESLLSNGTSQSQRVQSKKNLKMVNRRRKFSKGNVPTNSSVPVLLSKKRRNRNRKNRINEKKRIEGETAADILELTTARKYTEYPSGTLTDLSGIIEKLNKNPASKFRSTKKSTSAKKISKRKRCEKNNGGCSQKCLSKGKKKCGCFEGYVLAKNRKLCIDIDECKYSNGGCEQICENTLGAHLCSCKIGLRLSDDQRTCQDINECLLRNGHGPCQEVCKNIHGSYICSCLNGTNLAANKHSCDDIDKCAEGSSGCSHQCINAHGRSYCSCPSGMQLMRDWKTCEDIDECNDDETKMTCKYGCVNTIGSFYCEEKTDDYQNDQFIGHGKHVVCRSLEPPRNGFITCDRNDRSFYDIFSKTGRRTIRNRPGTKCKIKCRHGFKLIGDEGIFCGLNGVWTGGKNSSCQGKS